MKTEFLSAVINLLNVKGLGPHRVRSLVTTFPNAESIFDLSVKTLCSAEGIDIKSARTVKNYSHFDHAEQIAAKAEKLDVNIVSFWDENYPILLKKIYDPPVLLYCKGKQLKLKSDCVSVVGTRKASAYGKSAARHLSEDLCGVGMTIVSGLARGIDSIAHKSAIQCGGKTIAVLGSGVDVIYPPENKSLYKAILENGTVISEFPLGTKPDAGNFPQRNRIISGLSHGTLVVEAGNKSGAILTALNAVDQGREVFAVPARITDKTSAGCLRLIRNGAIPAESAKRILEHIHSRLFQPRKHRQEKMNLNLKNDERSLYDILSHKPLHIDVIAKESGKTGTETLSILLSLELKGAAVQLSGKQFVRA
ncbi:MAG: DNA-processing protein DprA [Candidatus Marinimicrobia bacterium]|jgi:DNA processing protein|nr:DNA-processing protein DprA [Candidatus Neomarinimicrobiota bacterium]MDP6789245.1 DNA-processing protein DprA [Candidatus Neomarinimicrobiota bacterium]MDP7072573.1 DNA-processing protein DprA [Candidatus Neomarinimicrobiota bacterium]